MKVNIEAFNEPYRKEYAIELREIFEKTMDPFCPNYGSENSQRFFETIIIKSEENGFKQKNEIIKFAFISIYAGLFFKEDPLYFKVMNDALWANEGVHPNIGLNRMFNHVDLMIAEGILGNTKPFSQELFAATPAKVNKNQTIHSILEMLTEINEKRTKAFGEDMVRQALEIYAIDETVHNPSQIMRKAEWIILSYFLGFHFHKNPLYQWIPEILTKNGYDRVLEQLNG